MPKYQLERLNPVTKTFEAVGHCSSNLQWCKDMILRLRTNEAVSHYPEQVTYPQGNYRTTVACTKDADFVAKCYVRGQGRNLAAFWEYITPEIMNTETFSICEAKVLKAGISDIHFDIAKEGLICFFETDEKRALEQPTSMKIGRFLKRYFGFNTLQCDQCSQHMVASLKVDYSILEKTGEIVSAYKEGPHSCMAYDTEHFHGTTIHPVHVYGKSKLHGSSSDLDLLVVKRAGSITGRCLVWQDRLIHGRIYGDEARVKNALHAINPDYKAGSFIGAKINKIELSSGAYVMAYLDNDNELISYDDKHWIIVMDGDYVADDHMSGTLPMDGKYCCEDCGESGHEDYFTHVDNCALCEHCLGENYFLCERTNEWSHRDRAVEVRTGGAYYAYETWDEDVAYEDAYFCDRSSEYVSYDHEKPVHMHDGETWCESVADELGVTKCKQSGEMYLPEDMIHIPAFDGLVNRDYAEKHFVDLFPETVALAA